MNRLNLNKILFESGSSAKLCSCLTSGLLAIVILCSPVSIYGETIADSSFSSGMEPLPSQGIIGKDASYARQEADFPLVPPSMIKQAGYILPFPEREGTIVANYLNLAGFTAGDFVQIDIGSEKGVSPGDRFTVSRSEQFIYHPVLKTRDQASSGGGSYSNFVAIKGFPLGYLINILGELEVLEVNANDSKAIIRESYQEMTNGDRITAKRTLPPLPSNKAPEEKDIGGYIVASRSASSVMQVKNMIVYLDAGSEQKVAPGDLFEVYVVPEMENKKALSPRVLGELLVVDTQYNTSTAVILKSNVELSIGQKVRYKK